MNAINSDQSTKGGSHVTSVNSNIEDRKVYPQGTFLDDLKRRMEATKHVRFRAYRRLSVRHKLSSYTISLLSIYVISLSLLPNILSISSQQSQLLLACTIVLSIFIIVLSQAEGNESFHHQAEIFRESARQISEISSRLSQYKSLKTSIVERIEEESVFIEKIRSEELTYSSIINECRLDHSIGDYLWVRAVRPVYFSHLLPKNPLLRALRRFWDLVCCIGSEFLWLVPAMLFSTAIFFTVYVFILHGRV